MSKENVEAIRLSNEAFNRGDLDEALAPHHPEVEWEDLNPPPDVPGLARGTDEIRELLAYWHNSFDELTAHVEEFVDMGETVVCVTRWHARGIASGLTVDATYAEVYDFEDGKIVRATVGYPSRAEALRAAGG